MTDLIPSAAEVKSRYKQLIGSEREAWKQAVIETFLEKLKRYPSRIAVADNVDYGCRDDWKGDILTDLFESKGYKVSYEKCHDMEMHYTAYVEICDSSFYNLVAYHVEAHANLNRDSIPEKQTFIQAYINRFEKEKDEFTKLVTRQFRKGVENLETEIRVGDYSGLYWKKLLIRNLFKDYKVTESYGDCYVKIEF